MGNTEFLKTFSKKTRIWDLKVGRWHLSKGDTSRCLPLSVQVKRVLHDSQKRGKSAFCSAVHETC